MSDAAVILLLFATILGLFSMVVQNGITNKRIAEVTELHYKLMERLVISDERFKDVIEEHQRDSLIRDSLDMLLPPVDIVDRVPKQADGE